MEYPVSVVFLALLYRAYSMVHNCVGSFNQIIAYIYVYKSFKLLEMLIGYFPL